jgi:methionyl-tRNA formyltransferase
MAQNLAVSALKLVFLGSDPIALPLLEWLAGEGRAWAEVAAVFTQPDRPAGRGQLVAPNAIKQWAQSHHLRVFQPEKLTHEVRLQLVDLQADVALVMAYGHLLGDDCIATPRLGILNLHTSRLPRYRGASPIQTAVACGESCTAVSLMRIVRQLDAGPVADLELVPIAARDTAAVVEAKLALACVPLLARTLPRLAAGTLNFTEQDHAAATFCRKLTKEDGHLDFALPAPTLAARINGLYPWPACSVEINGQPVKFGCAEASGHDAGDPDDPARTPGVVCGTDAVALRIGTGQGLLRVHRLQRSGGRMLPAAEFLRGFPVAPGTRLASRPMTTLLGLAPFRR